MLLHKAHHGALRMLQRLTLVREAVTVEGPSVCTCHAVVIRVDVPLDLIVSAITKWTTPCPPALTPSFQHLPVNEPPYAIGYNGIPTTDSLQEFGNFQMRMFNECVTVKSNSSGLAKLGSATPI
ncbi:hypothetical protein PCANC_03641 [Puccinia coronata f. sp. avenae]|uniref:Uncharacterized protein n=1 Tax=Puccinia coronata f. sp. avenae TaxID=200324 RepID=A0A2N5SXN9_9BASI|nr:hypothetical protein PCANC_07184 [Puccinia coronata f. sp. avenae]PLW23293.1 hypothetical protein PCASD_10960 [Puccinia coronata f. sp. avenae]PLW36204.1 hypothetical protein PCASD_10438 [Puccinia coronata f. sp. avenae]PLW53777.1 hypothetical protein PCANC_03641 [Puccinia coronata f. sp. avenae]